MISDLYKKNCDSQFIQIRAALVYMLLLLLHIRAARYFACDSHAYLVDVSLHQLFLNGASFNTQSRRSLISYTIRTRIACDSEREIG